MMKKSEQEINKEKERGLMDVVFSWSNWDRFKNNSYINQIRSRMMMEQTEYERRKAIERGFINIVFSWSISNLLNNNLYKNEVREIPESFSSVDGYLKTFIFPLLEETRSDLLSNMSMISSAPVREVYWVSNGKDFKSPTDLVYDIDLVKPEENTEKENLYIPQGGDLIAFTERKPKCIDDLNTPRRPYLIALVRGKPSDEEEEEFPDQFSALSANYIEFEHGQKGEEGERKKLFIVLISNMTTNVRIWVALNSDQQNVNIIKQVLHSDESADSNCAECSVRVMESSDVSQSCKIIRSFKLDDSQQAAVTRVIGLRGCNHTRTVKLIWGPPGTGKTKTVGSLLFALLNLKCRTLTCAPTNVAVVGVASRLMSFVKDNLEHYPYGLGDIVLFGNPKRMKIDEHFGLSNVFLENRVRILKYCYAASTGWTSSLESMTCLLKDPEESYKIYLKKKEEEDERRNCKNMQKITVHETADDSRDVLTFDLFFQKDFNLHSERLMQYVPSLYTHLPTCFISLENVNNMKKVIDLLKEIRTLIKVVFEKNQELRNKLGERKLSLVRSTCIELLKLLQKTFSLPKSSSLGTLCLLNTCLIFCTASSSAKLHTEGSKAIELLIIDEAAQLKECESTIPLQLPGLRHAVLVGDERQLPAMVQSKICEKAMFGRSLFGRLALLGHPKHLLNTQYRMHPSISQFPSKEFYDGKIMDSQNVKLRSYERIFLEGKMFGPYSFINVNLSKEDQGIGFSRKNLVEAAVVADLLANLFKESKAKRQKVSVGCISPYKAQVFAIKDKIGKLYSADPNSEFSVKVSSVDGFQGSEEDIIIISTVRSNGNGSIGFLSNFQRTNVALTRARYCLWVLGNEATLTNSGSVWKRLVVDAKERNCFHNADEDKNLDKAIKCALQELGQIGSLFDTNSLLFKYSLWKVCFSAEFKKSMTRIRDVNIQNDVVALVTKLASGWRREDEFVSDVSGTCKTLMEQYNVNEELILVWTIDILNEKSKSIQVIKIWEILSKSRVLQFADNLNNLFGNYTVNVMNRCQFKQLEGDLVVPATWPVDSNVNCYPNLSLTNKFSGLTLNDKARKEKWPVDSNVNCYANLSLTNKFSGLTLNDKARKEKWKVLVQDKAHEN